MGLIIVKTTHPSKKEVKARIKKIFIFEKPYIFKISKSLLFLIFIINHILETKIMKGRSLSIKLGTNKVVKIKGLKIVTFIFLKNSISSNRFKITPKQKIIKTTIKNNLKKLERRYLSITLFMMFSSQC